MPEKEIFLKTLDSICCGAEARGVILGCSGGSKISE